MLREQLDILSLSLSRVYEFAFHSYRSKADCNFMFFCLQHLTLISEISFCVVISILVEI